MDPTLVMVGAVLNFLWAIALLALTSRISKYTHDTQKMLERTNQILDYIAQNRRM